jgi:hypothetical protein
MNRCSPQLLPVLLCFAIAWILPGCRHTYKMRLDASARPDALSHTSYRIRDLSLGAAAAPAAHEAAENYVRTALSAKGMYEALTAEAAELEVTFRLRAERDAPAAL